MGNPTHGEGEQVPETDQDPALQVASKVPVYPVSHTGTHVEPEATSALQSPTTAFVNVGIVRQRGAMTAAQIPVTVQAPASQVAEGVPAKSVLHVSMHVVPLAAPEVHVP